MRHTSPCERELRIAACGSRTSMHIDAVDLEVRSELSGIVQEMQNSLFRTGFSTIVRESQDASCALMNANGEVVAQHVVLPLHIGAFPACCARGDRRIRRRHRRGRRLPDQSPLSGRQPARAGHVRASRRCSSTASCSASAARSRTRATSAGRCREAAPARRARPSTRACICRRCAISARFEPQRDIERIIAANSRTPELVLGDIRGQLGADRLGERRLQRTRRANTARTRSLACFARLFEIGESARARRHRRMGGRPLRGRTLRRRRRHRAGKAGAHPRRRREEAATGCISISPAPPTRPRARPISARRWCRRPAPMR